MSVINASMACTIVTGINYITNLTMLENIFPSKTKWRRERPQKVIVLSNDLPDSDHEELEVENK